MNRIFYHSCDLDGKASGAIAKMYFEENKMEYKLYPINYGEPFPWDDIKPQDNVYFVDFSLQPETNMLKLHGMCTLFVMDHHKSALKAYDDLNFHPKGIQRLDHAGCGLTWMYFYPDTEIPVICKLLDAYDLWDFSDDRTNPIQYYMRLQDADPLEGSFDWRVALTNPGALQPMIEKGDIIVAYQRQIDTEVMKHLSYEVEWEGYLCIVCNVSGNSQTFESKWDPEKHDIMVMYKHVQGKHFTISLYTTKDKGIDVSVIAERYKGGGHICASGFQTKQLPWQEEYRSKMI